MTKTSPVEIETRNRMNEAHQKLFGSSLSDTDYAALVFLAQKAGVDLDFFTYEEVSRAIAAILRQSQQWRRT